MSESLEERRFDFEQSQANKEDQREAKRAAQGRQWQWIQFMAVFIPLAAGVIGYFFQSAAARNSAKLRFIDRQLSELYYPVSIEIAQG